ncbi:hypothetical protein RAE08_09005, partial [Corynebacterium tuberculostearicum]|nr:hypothetical protein [Corynebacterium tuberculostearicum]
VPTTTLWEYAKATCPKPRSPPTQNVVYPDTPENNTSCRLTQLRGVGKRLGVSEFVVTGDMPDVDGRARSEELLASLQAKN